MDTGTSTKTSVITNVIDENVLPQFNSANYPNCLKLGKALIDRFLLLLGSSLPSEEQKACSVFKDVANVLLHAPVQTTGGFSNSGSIIVDNTTSGINLSQKSEKATIDESFSKMLTVQTSDSQIPAPSCHKTKAEVCWRRKMPQRTHLKEKALHTGTKNFLNASVHSGSFVKSVAKKGFEIEKFSIPITMQSKPLDDMKYTTKPKLGNTRSSLQKIQCWFCGRNGHAERNCRHKFKLCFTCGSSNHFVQQCKIHGVGV